MIDTQNGSRTAWTPERSAEPQNEHLAATLTELAFGIARDAQSLLRQQLTMLSAEVDEDLRKTKASVQYFSFGIVLMTVGGLALLFAAVHVLVWLFPALPLWEAEVLVGGLCVVAGAVFLYFGQQLFTSFNPLPDKTLKALTENLTWITNPRK